MISTNEPYLIKHNITGIEKQGVTKTNILLKYRERNI